MSSKKLIGSVQIRIRYHYQLPSDIQAPILTTTNTNTPDNNGFDIVGSNDNNSNNNNSNGNSNTNSDSTNSRHYTYNCADDHDDSPLFNQTGMFPAPPMRRVSHRPDIDFPITSDKRKNDSYLSLSPTHRKSNAKSISLSTTPTDIEETGQPTTSTQHTSQHGRGELARDENIVDVIFHRKLAAVMDTHVPCSESSSTVSKRSRIRRIKPTQSSTAPPTSASLPSEQQQYQQLAKEEEQFSKKGNRNPYIVWLENIFTPIIPKSSRGQRYGFQQTDTEDHTKGTSSNYVEADKRPQEFSKKQEQYKDEQRQQQHCGKKKLKGRKKQRRRDRIKEGASRKARHIIDSVNFGDKNFASQWMRDSFDDVAIAHPAFDRLISLVVSSQTRALVRSIMKLANAFVSNNNLFSYEEWILIFFYKFSGSRIQGDEFSFIKSYDYFGTLL